MRFSRILIGAGLAVGMATAALAQPKYPDAEVPNTVRVIVAYNAGGSSDTLARVTLPYWEDAIEELTGQSTNAIVVNLPGAGGEIGWTSLSFAQPDGSTIGIINLPAVPIVEAARDPGYEPWLEKFNALGVNVVDPNVVRLAKTSKHATLADAIQAAKDNPGSVTVGSDGPLSDDHVAMFALEQATGAKFTFVAFAGASPANQAFLSGEIDISIGNAFDHAKTADGASDAVVLRPTRYEAIPDVPTIEEHLGFSLGNLGSTRGFASPAGIPDDLNAVYREAFELAFSNEDLKAESVERGITIVEPFIGDAFANLMKDQQALADSLLPLLVEGGFINK